MIDFHSERLVLANGLRLLCHHSGRVPLVSLGAFVLAGKDQNPPDRPGLAALTARLLDEGTVRHDHQQISEILEGMGAQMTTFSERELSGVVATLQSGCLETGLDILAEILVEPVFPEPRVELEKRNVLNHIQAMRDDPQVVGSQALNRWIYQGTPLEGPTLGTPESLQGMSGADLARFHRAKYGPQNTVIVAVGDIDCARVAELVERKLGGWTNPDLELTPLSEVRRRQGTHEERIPMAKEQLAIYLGHLGIARSNPDYYVAQVMDAILGGGPGFTSRIPKKIRDDAGLAYTTYADLAGSAGLHPGRFVAFVGTAPEKGERAIKALRREIERFQKRGPTQAELQTARQYLTGSFVFEFQSNANIARFLLSVELFNLDRGFLHSYPQLIGSVTRQEVLRVARQCLDTVDYATVIVGPV